MSEVKLSDHQMNRVERELISRRRLMQDVCAVTGWVFVNGLVVARANEPIVVGDPSNSDKDWGSVKGRVVFDGAVPEVKEIELDKAGLSADDLKWFKSMGPVLNQDWVIDSKSKSVQWVYVWLVPEESKAKFAVHPGLAEIPADQKLIVVDQDPTGYVPHAIALRPEQGILMRNQGPVGHVFNFTGFANDAFNRAMPPNTEIKVENLKMEKSTVQINCPPHPWERMWMRMFDHPYFAITGADGTFEIKNAPVGKCRMIVWHEKAGFLGGRAGRNGSSVTIEGGAVTNVGDLKLQAKTSAT